MSEKRNIYLDNLLVQCMSLGENDMAESMLLSEELCKFIDGTLLHYAVACGNVSAIVKLIKLGSDVDCLDSSGRTALMIAVKNQHVGIVNILLNANADVDIVGPEGISPLQMIFHSDYGNKFIHEAFLLAVKSQFSSTEELTDKLYIAGCLASHAVFCRNAQVIEGLLKHGVDVNSTTCYNKTALHIAASRNEFQLVKVLVENGADVNAVDDNGSCALLSAALIGNDAMLTFLLDQGADINYEQPFTGWTALFLIYEFSSFHTQEQFVKCAEILIERGAVPRNSTTHPSSILEIANDKPYTYKSKLLIAYLAMRQTLGFSDIESLSGSSIAEYHLRYPEFGHFHDMCQQVLNTTVFQSLTLLDLLTASDRRMVIHVRNDTFLPIVTQFYSQHNLSVGYPLFFKMLDERVSKAVRKMNLENTSIPIICNILDANCYIVARQIVGYLNERDLEHFNTLGDLIEMTCLST